VMHWPAIAPWLVNDFVRGGITGLGVVNIGAGIADGVAFFRHAHAGSGEEREGG